MNSSEEEKQWNDELSIPDMSAKPAMPDMSAVPVNQGLYAQQVIPQQQSASPALQELPGQALAPQSAAPATPTFYQVGTMRSDGNEWLEYPDASGAWYMRDPTSKQWVRKI